MGALFLLLGRMVIGLTPDDAFIQTCRADYARAHTGDDSALVDAKRPATGARKTTCGVLRTSGRLQ